jgi:DNA repair exonuclease SbcCD ATPase subunit
MPVHITALEVENVKRVKAVAVDCSGALTVIGGRNGQGKTSVLDAIVWALGGDRFRPTNPIREGEDKGYIKVVLDNGVIVERTGVNGTLKVTSGSGKGGQALLNEFVNTFALNAPKFMAATGIEKAKMLLDCFPGLGKRLADLNEEHKKVYDERHAIGQIADRKAKYAKELPYDAEAPEMPLSGADMANRLRDALAHNARNEAIRQDAKKAEANVKTLAYRRQSAQARVTDLEKALAEAVKALAEATEAEAQADAALKAAAAATLSLADTDTTSIQKEMEEIDAINARVRANESKKNAEAEASDLRLQYTALSDKLDRIKADRLKLLASVAMPLPDLSVSEDGELIFHGQKWDCMSGAEQLRVATAICAAVNPKCGFVLLDKLECMDTETLREFGEWLESKGLQAIGTRVSTGEECSIIIEDGMRKGLEF